MSTEPSSPSSEAPTDASFRPALIRLVKLTAVLFALVMVGVALAAYRGPADRVLQIQYDGFD
jgi:hypothetical protein